MEKPEIIKHDLKWNAYLRKRYATDRICIHCTASKEGVDWSVEGIDKSHKNRGWAGIGYNLVIYRDGSIHEGRPIECQGAHCPENMCNSNGIGIVYVGGVDKNNKPKDTRTDAQKQSLRELVCWLQERYGIQDDHIFGHNQFANKACPSFSVPDWLKGDYLPWKQSHTEIAKCDLK